VIKPLHQAMPPNGFFLLVAGGVMYTVGGVIYALKKPNFSKSFGFHELFHIFVILGSFCHFLCVLLYLL
jgi:hemolysin III